MGSEKVKRDLYCRGMISIGRDLLILKEIFWGGGKEEEIERVFVISIFGKGKE